MMIAKTGQTTQKVAICAEIFAENYAHLVFLRGKKTVFFEKAPPQTCSALYAR
jgi:hypothetical protein